MNPAIRVQNLSKRYRVGRAPGARNLTDTLKSIWSNTAQKLKQLVIPGAMPSENVFWALQDVSFDVQPGEVVGIIGRNGAGKSTLLKLLSRITVPTSGRIEVRGRMGSLLEVGTGFHPELTGRENVFLNGSILGMTRREILAKFDRIVEFAEIGRHLDSPVKHYSSGMYVRLAFAVAAHLEPEILIIDEVLAVGDVEFQRRCIDRMKELARSGATILLVTHNMQLVPQLCSRAVFLERGKVVQIGSSEEVTRHYVEKQLASSRIGDLRDKPHSGDGRAQFVKIGVTDGTRDISILTSGSDLVVHLEVESSTALPGATIAVFIQSLHGMRLVSGWSRETRFNLELKEGINVYECRLSQVDFRPGQPIMIGLRLATEAGGIVDELESAAILEVVGDERHYERSTFMEFGFWLCPQEWRRL